MTQQFHSWTYTQQKRMLMSITKYVLECPKLLNSLEFKNRNNPNVHR